MILEIVAPIVWIAVILAHWPLHRAFPSLAVKFMAMTAALIFAALCLFLLRMLTWSLLIFIWAGLAWICSLLRSIHHVSTGGRSPIIPPSTGAMAAAALLGIAMSARTIALPIAAKDDCFSSCWALEVQGKYSTIAKCIVLCGEYCAGAGEAECQDCCIAHPPPGSVDLVVRELAQIADDLASGKVRDEHKPGMLRLLGKASASQNQRVAFMARVLLTETGC